VIPGDVEDVERICNRHKCQYCLFQVDLNKVNWLILFI